ncbi:hypothetical protein LTR36_009572 [Oleoguttula mirabilis]|uniref:Vitellogenin n=1 Tax=Oleoguttula mirabilis TaxID=1507867 RepID=A0AAV9JSV2_9PEZI|nr:hypothetical protein LTR36_009572 [Oleoguttula mirabilis]
MVLFPSSTSSDGTYEIVYGSRPRQVDVKDIGRREEPPWQYAMLVRKSASGEITPLIRGQAWSTDAPWSMVLQGLLDITATAIHRKIGSNPVPPLGSSEDLPAYAPRAAGVQEGVLGG